MKHTFILDENVIARGKNAALARLSLLLARLIKQNCHHVAIDRELNKRLRGWLEQRNNAFAQVNPLGVNLLRDLLTDSRKKRFVESHEVVQRQYVTDPDDWFLVDLAVSAGGAYVVSPDDDDLRRDLNNAIFAPLGVRGVTMEQAIELARHINGPAPGATAVR